MEVQQEVKIEQKMAKKIEMVAIEKLLPYAQNSRSHSEAQVDQICASIVEFGFTNPVLTDGKRGVIAGHGRLMAAKKLGMQKVPTIELSYLTENQKRAYIIADNRIAENSSWDDEILAAELGALQLENFNLELTGFGLEDFENLQHVQPDAEEDTETHTIRGKTPTEKLEKYLAKEIKQLTLFYEKDDYSYVLGVLKEYAKNHGLDNNSTALLNLLRQHPLT
jgi:hypothetical protein